MGLAELAQRGAVCDRLGLDLPDDTRRFDRGRADVLTVGGHTLTRYTLEPGWRWSQSVKPMVGTESCRVAHLQYCLSGRLHVMMDDGQECELGPGDVMAIQPGHDAWVVGSDDFAAIEFYGTGEYAKPRQ